MISFKTCVFFIYLIILSFACSWAYAENDVFSILWPVELSESSTQLSDGSHQPQEGQHILRTGSVNLAVDRFLPEYPEKDNTTATSFNDAILAFSFFPDKQYSIRVDSEFRPGQNAYILNGRIIDQDMASFSMTVTSESYLITLQDLDEAIVYRVVGSSETGLGVVTEIDLTKTPPIKYLPPVIPDP